MGEVDGDQFEFIKLRSQNISLGESQFKQRFEGEETFAGTHLGEDGVRRWEQLERRLKCWRAWEGVKAEGNRAEEHGGHCSHCGDSNLYSELNVKPLHDFDQKGDSV